MSNSESEKDNADKPLPEDLESIEGLSKEQTTALSMLIEGSSVSEIAEYLEIARSTIYRWLSSHEKFRQTYADWQENVLASVRRRVLVLSDAAATALEKALDKGDAKTGMALLGKLRMLRPAPRARKSDSDKIVKPE